ncbi:hypothetical protein ES332_D12G182900v1 [Gossypium tomentosum]|uniref:Pectinesterase inhibitor domain-containing protein n=1 Tax=Gossypium tomentosum TaxID=34277 RepID=A0A5D2IA52_GOSTO|nr:hypothetical protein ES332_D12G182900v1 [Gossypium tomentosum]
MKSLPSISMHFLIFLFFFLHPIPTLGSTVYDTSPTDYIRTSCSATLYPDLCYTSLSGYANPVQQDPARLARIAIGVSLSKARRMASYVSNLTRETAYGADPQASAALHDSPGSESFRFQMGNVQTWMSAALTDEETCTDGFEDVREGPLKTEVYERAVEVKKLTSNALALVNSYAEKAVSLSFVNGAKFTELT